MAKLTDHPPTPPPRSPFLPPAQRPQLPPAGPALRQRAAAALFLAVLSVIAMMWGADPQRLKYVAAVALVVALTGLALAFSAMRAAKRATARRPRAAVAGAVIGVLAAVFSGAVLGAFLLYSSQVTQYVTCMSSATTTAAQNACWQQLQNSVGAGANVIHGK
ncbi:MAG TPA: hypothetical protein VFO01_05945 [Trebonia sp.]|nr:hypothetical protein [Trebonia sp.]